MSFRLWSILAPLTLTVSVLGQETPSFGPQELSFFENNVRPILKSNCDACHNPTNRSSGLSLDSRESVLKGGKRGPAAQPGVPGRQPADPRRRANRGSQDAAGASASRGPGYRHAAPVD